VSYNACAIYDIEHLSSVEFIQPSTFIRMSHTFLGQLTGHLTRVLIPCDTFHIQEKQSDTFAEQRRHFISTAPAVRFACTRGRSLIDGVLFRFLIPRRGRVISTPVSLFFSTGARAIRAIDLRPRESSFLSFLRGFLSSSSAASNDLGTDPCRYTHFICLVSTAIPLRRRRSVSAFRENFCETFHKVTSATFLSFVVRSLTLEWQLSSMH